MEIVPASDDEYAHVVLSPQECSRIQQKVRQELEESVRFLLSNLPKDEKEETNH